ncbi:MAG: hypothetical protein Kow0069_35560 [Promethearchaeota archaeon]
MNGRVSCTACDQAAPAVNYCEICHSLFCKACTRVVKVEDLACGNCGATGGEVLKDTSGVYFCRRCKSQNVRASAKTTWECPECHSSAVVNVREKLLDLNGEFLAVVQSAREFVGFFDRVVGEYHATKARLLSLRNGKYRANHFPTMDSDFLNAGLSLAHALTTAWQRVEEFFDHALRHVRFFEVSEWSMTQVPIVENVLGQVCEERDRVVQFLDRLVKKFGETFREVDEKIEFVERVVELFDRFSNLLVLDAAERPVFALECALHKVNQDVSLKTGGGVILVTSQRVVFLHESGLFRKKHEVIFSLPLEKLDNVEIRGRFLKKVALDFQSGEFQFNLDREKRELLVQYIEMAKQYERFFGRDDQVLQRIEGIKLDRPSVQKAVERSVENVLASVAAGRRGAGVNLPGDLGTLRPRFSASEAREVVGSSGFGRNKGRDSRVNPVATGREQWAGSGRTWDARWSLSGNPGYAPAQEGPETLGPPVVNLGYVGGIEGGRRASPAVQSTRAVQAAPKVLPRGAFHDFSFDAPAPPALPAPPAPHLAGVATQPNRSFWVRKEMERVARQLEAADGGRPPGYDADRAVGTSRASRAMDGVPRSTCGEFRPPQVQREPPPSQPSRLDRATREPHPPAERRLREVEREIWSIEETLRKLDHQLARSKLQRIEDYAATCRSLQRELYELLQEREDLRRHLA